MIGTEEDRDEIRAMNELARLRKIEAAALRALPLIKAIAYSRVSPDKGYQQLAYSYERLAGEAYDILRVDGGIDIPPTSSASSGVAAIDAEQGPGGGPATPVPQAYPIVIRCTTCNGRWDPCHRDYVRLQEKARGLLAWTAGLQGKIERTRAELKAALGIEDEE